MRDKNINNMITQYLTLLFGLYFIICFIITFVQEYILIPNSPGKLNRNFSYLFFISMLGFLLVPLSFLSKVEKKLGNNKKLLENRECCNNDCGCQHEE